MTSDTNWENAFDEKFDREITTSELTGWPYYSQLAQEIKDFIRSLLNTAKQEGRDEAVDFLLKAALAEIEGEEQFAAVKYIKIHPARFEKARHPQGELEGKE